MVMTTSATMVQAASLFLDGAGLAVKAGEKNGVVRSALSKLYHRVKSGKMDVVVFGPGGVGKSTLGRIMASDPKLDEDRGAYMESISIETPAVNADYWGKIMVPPGQQRRRDLTWKQLFTSLNDGESVGVINIVADGLHSFADVPYHEHKIAKHNSCKTPEEFLVHYRQDRRAEELQIIQSLVQPLCQARRNVWMITLVTKQDLWWHDRVRVQADYMQGQYNEEIQKISNNRGTQNFSHHYFSASLVTANLRDSNSVVLAPTAQGYEESIKKAHLHHLVSNILSLTKQVKKSKL